MRYIEMKYLNEIFLDADITKLINLAYNLSGGSYQTWPSHIRAIAFGPSSA